MEPKPELRCLIAAGGTVGHLAPSLAVAEALESRGVLVTFAGSPDRIEAQLVPEAGYELDTFRVAGLPRRPSPALARALVLAARAPGACRSILDTRRAASERARDRGLRRDRAGGAAPVRRPGLRRAPRARAASGLSPVRLHRGVRRRPRRERPGARACRRLGLGARRSRKARSPRARPLRHGRSPDEERPLLPTRGRRRRRSRERARPCARADPVAARGSQAARGA